MRVWSLAVCSGLTLVVLSTMTVLAQPHTATRPLHSTPALPPDVLFKKVSKSVFIVEAVDTHGEVLFQQSGVAISPHVIASTRTILGTFANLSTSIHKAVARYRIRQGYRTWNVDKVFVDIQRDVSTFESPDMDAQPLPTAKPVAISVGERVYAVSFPKGQEETLTEGKVSSLDSLEDSMPIRTTISLGAESAGGGLFDINGKLIGLVSFSPLTSLNSGIPTAWLQLPHILYSGVQSQNKHDDATIEAITRAIVVSSNIMTFAHNAMKYQNTIFIENGENQAISHALFNAIMLRLTDKDSPESDDNWPAWRKTVANMEQLRTEIDSVAESGLMETTESGSQQNWSKVLRISVDDGRKQWSKVLDVYCKEVPSAPYTDLDGKVRACAPTH